MSFLRSRFPGTAAFAALMLLAGYGSSASPEPSATPTISTSIDRGCASAEPRHVKLDHPEMEALARVCASDDGSLMRIDNYSNKVLLVGVSGPPERSLTIEPAAKSTAADMAAWGATPPVDDGEWSVLPSRMALVASSIGRLSMRFKIDPERSAVSNAARSVQQWIDDRLSTPGDRFARRIADCADNAAQVGKEQPGQAQEVRVLLTAFTSCRGVVSEVERENRPPAKEPRPGTPTEPGRGTPAKLRLNRPAIRYARQQVVSNFKKLAGGNFVDELSAIIVKVHPRP